MGPARAPGPWWLAWLALTVDRYRRQELAAAHRGAHRVVRRGHRRDGLGVAAVPGVHRAQAEQVRGAHFGVG
jgi:hypothetical protein